MIRLLLRRIAATGIVAVGWCAGMPHATADNPICSANVCSFYSPSHNISCEIDYQRGAGTPDMAYCQIAPPQLLQQSVHMDPTGAFAVCTGETCLGNPGLGQATLLTANPPASAHSVVCQRSVGSPARSPQVAASQSPARESHPPGNEQLRSSHLRTAPHQYADPSRSH